MQSVGERQDTALGAVYRMRLMLGVRGVPPRCWRSCSVRRAGIRRRSRRRRSCGHRCRTLARSGQVAGKGADLDASGAVRPGCEHAG